MTDITESDGMVRSSRLSDINEESKLTVHYRSKDIVIDMYKYCCENEIIEY